MFNIFFIVGFAVFVAIALSVWMTRNRPPEQASLVPPEDDLAKDPANAPQLGEKELFQLAEKLCLKNQLRVKDVMKNTPRETYWIAESTNEFFFGTYVFCFLLVDEANQFATLNDLLEFKDFVKSMQSTKGFFFTNGYFTRDVHQPLEGPKVALYNRLKILEELGKLG